MKRYLSSRVEHVAVDCCLSINTSCSSCSSNRSKSVRWPVLRKPTQSNSPEFTVTARLPATPNSVLAVQLAMVARKKHLRMPQILCGSRWHPASGSTPAVSLVPLSRQYAVLVRLDLCSQRIGRANDA